MIYDCICVSHGGTVARIDWITYFGNECEEGRNITEEKRLHGVLRYANKKSSIYAALLVLI